MKKHTLKSAKKKAWTNFSMYIRLKACRETGYAKCVTCPPTSPFLSIAQLQAGHFIPGRGNAILFDERGVHVQCVGCNVFKSGNLIEYHKFMERRYGLQKALEIRDDLLRLKSTTVQYKIKDYQEIAELYAKKIEELK